MKIISTLILLLAINVSFANVNGTEIKPKKQQDQEQQTLRDGQKGEIQEQRLEGDTKSYDDVDVEEPTVEPVESDSVEDDSVSKYNFIFYFLYKFKYEAEA